MRIDCILAVLGLSACVGQIEEGAGSDVSPPNADPQAGCSISGRHRTHLGEGIRCSGCHAEVVDANMKILKVDLHVNGVHEVKMANGTWNATARTCANTGCHGTKSW